MKQGFGLQTINQPQCADEGTQSPRSPLDLDQLAAIAQRATAGPWCVEQCGEKEDAPVVGIAYRDDDHDCTNPLSGWLRPYDNDGNEVSYYRETIAYEIQSCDGASASSNAHFIATFNPATVLALIEAARSSLPLFGALRALTDNINEFGAVTDGEFMDAAYAAIEKVIGAGDAEPVHQSGCEATDAAQVAGDSSRAEQ